MAVLEEIYNNILAFSAEEVTKGVNSALDEGIPAAEILGKGLIAAMEEVGRRFEAGDFFVPEMLAAAQAMKAGVELLKPKLVEAAVEPLGKVVIGTVKGDLHDIGKNLVAMMLEGVGFEIIDLGTDVAPEAFLKAIDDHQPHFIGMSALLTTTMPAMGATVKTLQEAGVRDKVRIMVGGAPITQAYADEIGADIYAQDGAAAAREAKAAMAK